MLQIRLSKAPVTEGSVGAKAVAADSVTVACPDHLVLADLPVAKGIGAAIAASLVKTVGRRSRRQLGERVHFCVRCDFPIAIYGRLSPCEHAFCLDCARSDSICYLCDERIQKIQTIKLMEGIFICAAPHCLKSFLKRVDFESHIQESHSELLQTNADKEDNNNESEAQSMKQSSASESTLRAPLRPGFSPSSNSQIHDREDKNRRQLVREQSFPRPIIPTKPSQAFGQVHTNSSEAQPEYRHQGFDNRPHNPFQQPNYDSPGALKQDSATQGVVPESPYPDHPGMHTAQPPNYVIPVNPNQMMNPSAPYGYLPFMGDGSQPLYNNVPYDMGRLESAPASGPEQGSLLGFPPASGSTSFPSNNYHHQHHHHHHHHGHNQPWNGGQSGMPFEPPQGVQDGFTNALENQGKAPYFHAPPTRDGKGILAPQPMPHSLPPPPPPHMSQPKRKFYSEMGRDGQGYGWQHENRDGFGSGQD